MSREVNTTSPARKRQPPSARNHRLNRERLQHRQMTAEVGLGVGKLAASAIFCRLFVSKRNAKLAGLISLRWTAFFIRKKYGLEEA